MYEDMEKIVYFCTHEKPTSTITIIITKTIILWTHQRKHSLRNF